MPPVKRTPRKPTQTKLNFKKAGDDGGADGTTPRARRPGAAKPNGNILNFFKKVEVEEQLFCGDSNGTSDGVDVSLEPEPESESESAVVFPHANSSSIKVDADKGGEERNGNGTVDGVKDMGPSRYNEHLGSSKRRKLSHDGNGDQVTGIEALDSEASIKAPTEVPTEAPKSIKKPKTSRAKGPFLEDSDSDEDGDATGDSPAVEHLAPQKPPDVRIPDPTSEPVISFNDELIVEEKTPIAAAETPAIAHGDSVYDDFQDFQDLEELEAMFDDNDDDEFGDGEEFRERRFMEEQARLEAAEEEAETVAYVSDCAVEDTPAPAPVQDPSITESCPLCSASLAGITPEQATIHVNACLDGKPIPLPKETKLPSLPMQSKTSASTTTDAPEISKRFARAAVPRPGQANPISLGGAAKTATSAFSKLMSGHAEDAAWASAAAAEHASRGKPAYQRTCPFYKIMPGFFICVDAFRYGAVKGCNAYFLSHFHSDHYIGLTANWSHGPIYCSKVTGDLVKNQLRTNAKWVVPLEFDETVEVPGTQGVTVTMIPANHCPGSSLFLFEKKLGKGSNARTQRILHCGDFRACPAQVAHPLLRPEMVDSISGKSKQQKIDVCYLDTTYLNPRYSFPPQDDVIRACAEFCKWISDDPDGADGIFDGLKRGKGSTAVSHFFPKESDSKASRNGTATDVEAEAGKEKKKKSRLLVVCGTYSIGKERICKAVAQALGTRIYATPAKTRICRQLGDPELSALLTDDPRLAQVHMQALAEIRAETLQAYLEGYRPHFTHIVGFRPSGWNFRPAGNAAAANLAPSAVPTTTLLHGPAWAPRFGRADLRAQRGSTREAACFGVPYSEHSSFRELALFLMALRVERVVPTVNVGSEPARRRMKAWTDRWLAERRRGGLLKVRVEQPPDGRETDREGRDRDRDYPLWDGKDGKGGAVWW